MTIFLHLFQLRWLPQTTKLKTIILVQGRGFQLIMELPRELINCPQIADVEIII